MKTAVEYLVEQLFPKVSSEEQYYYIEQAKEMEKEKRGKFTIDFINWLHLNEYKYNPKAKLYQKQFINETLFFSIDELFVTFKQQEQ
jgi:hypothetical protein